MSRRNGNQDNRELILNKRKVYGQKKPMILDHGNVFSFPQLPLIDKMPAGMYQPFRDGAFMLRRISPVNQAIRLNAESIPAQTEDPRRDDYEDPDLTDFMAEISAALEDDDLQRGNSSVYHMFGQELDYLSDGYFPLEEYNSGLKHINKDIQQFLNQRDFYITNRLNYKRSLLLYGPPGTGKSRFIDNLSRKLIQSHDAVVIRMDSSSELMDMMTGLPQLEFFMQGQLKIIIIEELAELVNTRRYSSELLNLLDNQILKNDVMFLITTNYSERVPDNIINRPSRIDLLVNIENTSNEDGFIEAWYEHLIGKHLEAKWKGAEWYNKNLSPAYLKELFVYSQLHGVDLDESWKEIQRRLEVIENRFEKSNAIGFMNRM